MTGTEVITVEQVEDVLLHGGELGVVSAEDVQQDIVRRILESESLEEAFRQFQSVPMRDLEGNTITIHGVAWMRSAFKEGPAAYALLDCTVEDDDTHITVSMGGRSLLAGLLYAQRHEAMPFSGVPRLVGSRSDPEKSYWQFTLAPAKVGSK